MTNHPRSPRAKVGMTYRGFCEHGKVRVLISKDLPVASREIARTLAEGYTVDLVTDDEARKSGFGCDVCRLKKAAENTPTLFETKSGTTNPKKGSR